VRESLAEGLRIVRGSRVLAGIIMAAGVTMLGLGAVNVLFVPLIVNDLQVSPTWMAGIDLAQTIGMIAAAGLVTTLVRRFAPTTIITLGLMGIGLCIGVTSGVGAVWQVLVILLLVGLCVTPLQAMIQTMVQTTAGDASRGRVVSIIQASMSTASVASMAIAGIFGDLIGIRGVFLAAGVVVLGAAAISWVMFRGVSGRPAPSAAAVEPA
jgi:MFS transporter, DHA3 family, macrolide efflux protein